MPVHRYQSNMLNYNSLCSYYCHDRSKFVVNLNDDQTGALLSKLESKCLFNGSWSVNVDEWGCTGDSLLGKQGHWQGFVLIQNVLDLTIHPEEESIASQSDMLKESPAISNVTGDTFLRE